MDKKRLVIVMLLSLGVVFGWTYLHALLRQKHPEWFEQPQTQQTEQQQQQPTATQTTPANGGSPGIVGPSTAPGVVRQTAPATAPTTPETLQVVGGDALPTRLGNPAFDPGGTGDYPLALVIDPRGASIGSVTLNRFRRDVGKDEPYVYQQPYENVPSEQSHALATRYVVVNGQRFDLATVNWVRQSPAATTTTRPAASESVTYTIELRDASGQPVLAIDKTYRLFPKTHQSLGYEVALTYALRNLTSQPVRAELAFGGPTMPPPENPRDITEVVAGHNDDRQVATAHQPAANFEPDKEPQSLKHATYPLLWAGVLNAYFDAIVGPAGPDGKVPFNDVLASTPVKRTDAGREFTVLTYRVPEVTVPGGQQVSLPMHVYFGPRQRAVLNQAYYELFPRDYDQTLVLTSGPCGYCTFQWLINLLVWLLSIFYTVLHDWGLAIIMLVLLVRLMLHPITKRSQIAMSRMSKMGPEIDRLKKKYGDNKEELNKAMMSIYREQGITPILGCLPMLLQMPIWIALWSSLQSTFELRHASFLWGYTWIDDLAQPDRLIAFEPVKLWFFHLDALNLLPIILGVVFYVQMKMQPKPATMTPEQEQQQKMMQWMSLLFPLFLYNGPSGLNLYIATSTAIGIWESKRVRDHIKAQEEAEKRGVVVSDEPRGGGGGGGGGDDRDKGRGPSAHPRGPKKPEPPKGGLSGWLANLQHKAQEIQREVEKKRRDNR
jgi:YidC/Oxa1 family membrane protein insertase